MTHRTGAWIALALVLGGLAVYIGTRLWSGSGGSRTTFGPGAAAMLRTTQREGGVLKLAIEKYVAAHGAPPSSLSAIVPEFLPSLPSPGPAAEDGWLYWARRRGRVAGQAGKDSWAVGITVKKGDSVRIGNQFGDTFVYHADGEYGRREYGGEFLPMDDWGYYFQ